uniref:guanylate kinase n=1 Tax=Panagrellus redivivus TaxID=6233 RepID=A0A7E4VGE4_PANRE
MRVVASASTFMFFPLPRATCLRRAATTTSSSSSCQARRAMASSIRPIVLSGPSGGGKSTILKRAMQEHPDTFAFSVSHTTRNPRPGESHGKDYWFTPYEEMEKMIANDDFLEHAKFGGNLYGTSKKAVKDVQSSGKICVLDIELQGVRNVKKTDLNAKYILIRAPTIESLRNRLVARATETPETLERRLKHAEEDLEAVKQDPTLFDYVIINDNLETAYQDFLKAIASELKQVQQRRG